VSAISIDGTHPVSPSGSEIDEESRRLRRLRIVVNLSLSLIAEGDLPFTEAQQLAAAARRLAEELFPGKSHVYDLVYQPKFRCIMNEIYRLQ
jgi:hypothetical protein